MSIKIFQISSEVNSGSVGRIAEHIGEKAIEKGWESYIAYARDNNPSKSKVFRIGGKIDLIKHGLLTRLTDRHGFGSESATKKIIENIKEINPDLIQLHHLHGYFINIEILFKFLLEFNNRLFGHFMIVGLLQDIVLIMKLQDVINGKRCVLNARKQENIRNLILTSPKEILKIKNESLLPLKT